MVSTADLVDIAGAIQAPYQPEVVASSPSLTVSVVIYGGPKAWHREAKRAELLVVLEGVVTVDSRDGRLVVNEGELARVPSRAVFDYNSGMRSAAVLVQEPTDPEAAATEPSLPATGAIISKNGFAVDALHADAGEWRRVGEVGDYEAFATRVLGTFRPFTAPLGGLVIVVYRGVMDVTHADGNASIVGGQLLAAPEDSRLTFRSERGATALVLVRAGTELPRRLGG